MKHESIHLNQPNEHLVFDSAGNISGIRFIYPIVAHVELNAARNNTPLIECQARQRIEQRLEIVLNGAVPSMTPVARIRGKTPAKVDPSYSNQFKAVSK